MPNTVTPLNTPYMRAVHAAARVWADHEDWDEHELSKANTLLLATGAVTTTQYGLAEALRDANPGATLEGIPGQWYRVSFGA